MEQKTSSFDRVLGAWDILVIAFGAMIGWGWVVSTGTWIQDGGILGAALGLVIGGIMIFFVGLTYAELTSAMPQCGGEHVFSHRAMGPIGSFICTGAIVLGYASVVCFEACALPTIIEFNALADQGKYRKIYAYIANHEVPEDFEPIDLVALLRELNAVLGIPATLHDAGVTAESFDAMADDAMADDAMKSGNIAVNPRATTKADVLALYQKAL